MVLAGHADDDDVADADGNDGNDSNILNISMRVADLRHVTSAFL